MALASIAYNLLLAAGDAAALALLRRSRTARTWLVVGGGLAAFALALAAALGEDPFGIMRLAAYGLFVHGAVFLGGSAVALRRARPKTAAGSLAMALGLLAVAADAFVIEPHWLEVTRIRLASPKLVRHVRIVVVADLQTDGLGSYERRVLRQVLDEKPDLILLAGDYVQGETPEEEMQVQDALNAFLRGIGFSAPLGVFAVHGNTDGADWTRSFRGLPVTLAQSTQTFDLGPLRLTCLGLADSYHPELKVTSPGPEAYHVVLGHSPDFALGSVEADLLLAGHTHGGQVRLPLVGPPHTAARVPRAWAAGLTELPGGARLLVSRGVGMERGHAPRLRFLCRPELVVIDLGPP